MADHDWYDWLSEHEQIKGGRVCVKGLAKEFRKKQGLKDQRDRAVGRATENASFAESVSGDDPFDGVRRSRHVDDEDLDSPAPRRHRSFTSELSEGSDQIREYAQVISEIHEEDEDEHWQLHYSRGSRSKGDLGVEDFEAAARGYDMEELQISPTRRSVAGRLKYIDITSLAWSEPGTGTETETAEQRLEERIEKSTETKIQELEERLAKHLREEFEGLKMMSTAGEAIREEFNKLRVCNEDLRTSLVDITLSLRDELAATRVDC